MARVQYAYNTTLVHYIMSNVDLHQNKSVLWTYKHKLLGFTSHRKKRENKIKKEIKRGIREVNSEDPFELFLSLHDIRYVFYKETEKILGNTYGMVCAAWHDFRRPFLLLPQVYVLSINGLPLMSLPVHSPRLRGDNAKHPGENNRDGGGRRAGHLAHEGREQLETALHTLNGRTCTVQDRSPRRRCSEVQRTLHTFARWLRVLPRH